MTYRPVFKILSVLVTLFAGFGMFWLRWRWMDPVERYYLGPDSRFMAERILLPDLPSLPSFAGGTNEQPSQNYLVVECPAAARVPWCLALPGTTKKTHEAKMYGDHAAARAFLAQRVFHGAPLGRFVLPLVLTVVLGTLLLIAGAIGDIWARRRLFWGVQLDGRRSVKPEKFWRRRSDDFNIAIERRRAEE